MSKHISWKDYKKRGFELKVSICFFGDTFTSMVGSSGHISACREYYAFIEG